MKLRALAVVASSALVLLLACRGLVGIESIEVVDASASDAPTDTPASIEDAGADVASEPGDATDPGIAACASGADCRRCCKETFSGLREAETLGRLCFCRPDGGCASCAGQPFCTGSGPPPATCAPCIDDKLIKGECTETCTTDACQIGLACIRACP